MPTLTTDFNGILTGEQLGHIHGENERYRCQLWFAQGSLRKLLRAEIPPAGQMAVFAGPFWTLSIADTPHHSPQGRRSSHPTRAQRDAFRRRHAKPDIQPCGDHFDTGLSRSQTPFTHAISATLAGPYSQWRA